MNLDKAEAAMRDFLEALDIDLEAHNMQKTPKRVTEMYAKMFGGLKADTKDVWGETFEGGNSLVAIKNLPFCSICEHHLAPFFGNVNIAYLPKDGKIAGFGKFAKLVETLSHRPQLQEKLTEDIAEAVYGDLSARGALIVVSAKQLCMTLQGESLLESETLTSVLKGELINNESLANEAWRLIGKEKT